MKLTPLGDRVVLKQLEAETKNSAGHLHSDSSLKST